MDIKEMQQDENKVKDANEVKGRKKDKKIKMRLKTREKNSGKTPKTKTDSFSLKCFRVSQIVHIFTKFSFNKVKTCRRWSFVILNSSLTSLYCLPDGW